MSVITCDCSVDVDEPWRCFVATKRKARKRHTCVECEEPIVPGERYVEEKGIDYEGTPFRYHTCILCHRIREHYCPYGWYVGGLREQLMECIGFDYVTGPDEDDDDPFFDGDVALSETVA